MPSGFARQEYEGLDSRLLLEQLEQHERSMVSSDRQDAWETAHLAAYRALTVFRDHGGLISRVRFTGA
jgi:hypothetical protein